MPKKADPYKTLRVPKGSSKEAIKRAYRKRAKETHPDTARDDGAEFREVHKAYKLLTDDRARERYDQTGETEAEARGEPILELLASAFGKITDDLLAVGKDPATENLIGHIETLLRKAESNLRGAAQAAAKKETFWRRIVGRFESDVPDNIFEVMAGQRLAQVQQELRQIEDAAQLQKLALKELGRYSFRHDATQRASSAGTPTLVEWLHFRHG